MAGIFISYRRDDSAAQARAVWERLRWKLGRARVFMDVDRIDPGDDFTKVIDRQLEGCQVMLVMIGAKWHSITDPHGRLRLHNRHDFVRYEVETALRRPIRLVPVLIDNTPPPLEEHLPVELHPLLRRQALELDFRRHTEAALQRLVEVSRKVLGGVPTIRHRPSWMHDEGTDQYGRWCEFKVGNVVQRMRWIEAGTFWMGSPDNEANRSEDEQRHRVVLTQGYWMADTACTQALWDAVQGGNPSHFIGDPQRPVDQVKWEQVALFLSRLTLMLSGSRMFLPTEAQWEYACRAGSFTRYSWGDAFSDDQVNFGGRIGAPLPVKSLPANQWGLYQMHGNIWEMCTDGYAPYPRTAGEMRDPCSLLDRRCPRVLRGGSWFSHDWACRSASRVPFDRAQIQPNSVGFRFACLSELAAITP